MAGIFGLLKMVIFGDEDNMVERFVEIDARVFWTLHLHVMSQTGPRDSGKQWFLDAMQRQAKCS